MRRSTCNGEGGMGELVVLGVTERKAVTAPAVELEGGPGTQSRSRRCQGLGVGCKTGGGDRSVTEVE